jgi:membrane protein implicated in regulation of membrane protease activity
MYITMMQYLSENLWILWLIVAVACLILELISGGFFIICFAIGGTATAIAALLGANVYWQLFIFAVVSLLTIFGVRPFALKYLHRNDDSSRPSNADAIIGRLGFVSQNIEAGGFGRVAIDGDDWKAVSDNGQTIEKGEKVEVIGRDSIIITVKRMSSTFNNNNQ